MSADPHRDRDRLHDDLAAYALGALDEAEATELERHLEGCEACRSRVGWLEPAVNLLAGAVEQRTPSAGLREGLMAKVRAEAAPQPQPAPAESAGRLERRSWWQGLAGRALQPAVGMAAMIVLVVGLAVGYLLGDSGSKPIAPTFTRAQPSSAGVENAVSATLEREGDSATLHVQKLPKIARDEVYEVWVRRGGVMERRGVFVLNRDGSAEATVPGSLDGADAVLVTREPHGGSPQPTNPVLLEAPLE